MREFKRTHMMTEVTLDDVGKEIVLKGWVQKKRNLGGLVFVDLRDRTGLIQIIADPNCISEDVYNTVSNLKSEYVVAVKGIVQKRGGAINPEMKTGKIEVEISDIIVYSQSLTPPFHIEENSQTKEELRLKYRYLDLRRPDLQNIIMLRSKILNVFRNFLHNEGFIEVETPMLTKSTPEGARDYLVPSRLENGKFYALPQSPQLFKQLLMVSGFDKYFQITKCFRDEDLRADRQPEFTQLDLEMSFVDVEDIMALNEKMLSHLFREILNVELKTPFRKLTYKESMKRFGSDKPDLRFGMELHDISSILKNTEFEHFKKGIEEDGAIVAIKVQGQADISRKKLDALTKMIKGHGVSGLFYIQLKDEIKSSFAKFTNDEEISNICNALEAKNGDLILFVAEKSKLAYPSMGALRLHLGKELGLVDKSKYEFLWVTDFPLFEYSEEEGRYLAMHHPFTMVSKEFVDDFDTNKKDATARAYDIVLNGYELSSGSVRIHDAEIQQRMFDALGFTQEEMDDRFGFLIQAFKYGVPPHAGNAIGLDRLIMLMVDTENIRDVIAFPKTKEAVCLLTQAPDYVSDIQLGELGIDINKEN